MRTIIIDPISDSKNSSYFLIGMPTPASSSISTSVSRESDVRQDPLSPPPQHFMSRVSSLPLVNSAIKVYEQGKASNRVLNYGAGLVESSVKTIAAPLYGSLGKHVNINTMHFFLWPRLGVVC